MSLDDQFNPNDGSLIDKIDGAIFNFNKKISTKWQDKLYRKKEDLEKILYIGGAAVLGGGIIADRNFVMVVPAVLSAMKGYFKELRPDPSVKEQMALEMTDLPRKTLKYVRSSVYGVGVILTLSGAGGLIAGIASKNHEACIDSLGSLLTGLGTLGWISADYMAQSDIGNPPPKPKRKPVLKKIKEKVGELLPKPIPQPVPIRNYSKSDSYLTKSYKDKGFLYSE